MRAPRSARRPAQALAGILLGAALAVTGCSAASDDGGSTSKAADEAAAHRDAKGVQEGAPGGGRADAARATAPPRLGTSHIIHTVSLSVQVKDVPKALDEARATTENAGGYVGSEATTRGEEDNEHTRVVLRVPADKYKDVLAELEGAGRLLDRTAKARDVTDQVVDVESRISTQRASVARIRELMDRATKLSDVVQLEGELSRRQADLEALLAQQASLKDRTSLATITLSLSEPPAKNTAGSDDDPGVMDALTGGWDAFVATLRWIVVAVAAVLPFAALAALLVLLWLRLVRPRLSRPAGVTAAPAPAPGPLPAARPAPEAAGSPERGGQD
ncbi:lipoprotein [Streptomyces sp. AS58]|uniref:DUF4349 domain-containing protein n=1 Tax=Streptomyces cadmiisoli TaxID=2184053 RepID=A0A2Z4IW13_9ACTN|nr:MULTISPECIES: DUF4349 domain-containing protein [Streptomyces]AWW37052.1 DUF4349 domain-containing protein [Streptomyces cadmiisoli]KOV68227.1 lipoprotein [Streptomyces sp. AS58]